jgi:hypothetical protein
MRDAVNSVKSQVTKVPILPSEQQENTIRIFVSGDKSSVGKISVYLGILGSLVSLGYDPSSLAYTKPATQCESPQLMQAYCEKVGIPCVPLGPFMYYKGFTRAFLAGEMVLSSELLSSGGAAVDELARGKRIIMISIPWNMIENPLEYSHCWRQWCWCWQWCWRCCRCFQFECNLLSGL